MTHEPQRELTPRLRFPEFRNAGDWEEKSLQDICNRVVDRVGDALLTPVSITAGYGFVSQESKFGRDISGAQYKNYIFLRRGDFAYNRGNSKKHPQGYVCQLKEFDKAAASTAFLCFRLKDGYEANFIQGLFDTNIHGKQLVKHITSSARSDGLLNINPEVFFSIILPIPSQKEQQRIVDFLASLDNLIAAQSAKLDALKAHKSGLLQQLFPAEGETMPRLRFPEFRYAGEWISSSLGGISNITSGGTPNRSNKGFWNGNIPWVATSLIDFNTIYETNEYITELGLNGSSAKIFPKNTILMAMYGQGKTRGKVAILGIEAATNQACAAILLNNEFHANFVFQNLAGRYDEIREMSNAGGQENLSAGLIETIPISYPVDKNEQQKIADCLSSIDAQIAAQIQKLDALKVHKKGMLQQLLPSTDEVRG